MCAIEVEVRRQCYQFVGRMQPFHCQPAGLGVAQVPCPVAEIFQAAECSRNNTSEWLLRSKGFDPVVDNLQVFQLELQLHLGLEAGFLAVAVQCGDLLVGEHDG
ncbi:hypothetical protein D3C78_1635420 [compost metagenome]